MLYIIIVRFIKLLCVSPRKLLLDKWVQSWASNLVSYGYLPFFELYLYKSLGGYYYTRKVINYVASY